MRASVPPALEEADGRAGSIEPGTGVLRALGALLGYPDGRLRDALAEIAEMVRASSLIPAYDRAALLALIQEIASADPLEAEERYVERFDRGRAASLHLFEHVHGEARDRGQAMVELKALYERAGLHLAANELPDYLPVVLEYLSWRGLSEANELLGECEHILRSIGEALARHGSRYAAVPAALLGLIGRAGLAPDAGRAPEPEDIDRSWHEPPAFGPDSPSASAANGSSQS